MVELKPGDVVRSRLDPTPMTVESIDGVLVRCTWFAGGRPSLAPGSLNRVHRAQFNATVLTRVR